MKESTISKLNQINIDFYSQITHEFSDSRSFYWAGWQKVLEITQNHFDDKEVLSVLDLGCGNGRFALFLDENNVKFSYHGWDVSEPLLAEARDKLKNLPIRKNFKTVDILKLDANTDQKFQLITLFGVLHHIPGHQSRIKLLSQLEEMLTRRGLLVITAWDFLNDERLSKKIVGWDKVDIDETQLEEGDYLLDWKRGKVAYRYCHYTSEEEFEKIVSATNLKVLDKFNADGKSGMLNRYYILSK